MLSQKRTTIAIATTTTTTRMTWYYDNTTTTTTKAEATSAKSAVQQHDVRLILLLLLLQQLLSFQTVEAKKNTMTVVKDAIDDVRDIFIFDHHSSEKNIKVCFQKECSLGISVKECISNIRQSFNTNNEDEDGLVLRFHIVSDNDEELMSNNNNNNNNNDKQQVSASVLSSSSSVSLSYNHLRYYELPIPTNLLGEVSCLSSRDEESGTTVPIGQMIGFIHNKQSPSIWTVDEIHSFNMYQHLPTINCLGMSHTSCCLLYQNTLQEKHIPLIDIHGKQITCYPYVVSTSIPFMPIRHSSEEESSSSFGYVDYIWKSNDTDDLDEITVTSSRNIMSGGDNNDVVNKEKEEEEVDSSSLSLGGTCIPIELTINDDINHLEEHLQTSIQTLLDNIQSILDLSNHNAIKEQEGDGGGGDRTRYLRTNHHHSTKQQQQQRIIQQKRYYNYNKQQMKQHHERTLNLENDNEEENEEHHVNVDVHYITCHDILNIQQQIIDIARLLPSDQQTSFMNLNSVLLLKKDLSTKYYYCMESQSDLVKAKQIYTIYGHVMDWSITHGFEILPNIIKEKLVQLQKLLLNEQQQQQDEDMINKQYLQHVVVIPSNSVKNIVTSIPYRISTNNLNTLKQISCF